MIDINVPNVITIAIISVLALAVVRVAKNAGVPMPI